MTGGELFPMEYGYVVLAIVLYCLLNVWMQLQVGKARKKYKVFYPALYATEAENKDAKLFNCVQRGHQNSLENVPIFFILMILGGIKHPIVAASLGLLYNVSRYFYFTGYSTGDPKKRLSLGKYGSFRTYGRFTLLGKYGGFALLGLLGCTISFAVSLLMA